MNLDALNPAPFHVDAFLQHDAGPQADAVGTEGERLGMPHDDGDGGRNDAHREESQKGPSDGPHPEIANSTP